MSRKKQRSSMLQERNRGLSNVNGLFLIPKILRMIILELKMTVFIIFFSKFDGQVIGGGGGSG